MMVKKVGPRLRELAPAARGSKDSGSCNLGPTFFTIPVHVLDVVWSGTDTKNVLTPQGDRKNS